MTNLISWLFVQTASTQLFTAARDGDIATVRRLLAEGRVDVNMKDENGWSPLMDAIRTEYPLMIASLNGHLDVVKSLIEAKANINQTTKDGWSPLIQASYNGHLDVVKTLIEAGANVNQINKDGWSSLMAASREGHVDVVKTLIEAGANDGMMALDLAVEKGRKKIIDVLEHARSKKEQTEQLHDMWQQKEQTEQLVKKEQTVQQLLKKEQTEQQLLKKEQTEQQLHKKEQQLCDIRQQKEQREQLHDMRQQKEQTEQQLHDMRQQKEQIEQQLRDMKQRKEQTEQQLRDMKQQKEQTEQQLCDMRQQKEQTEELRDMRQQKEQIEQQLRDMKQRKEQTEQQLQQQKEQTEQQLHDMRQQTDAYKQQAQRAEKRAASAEQDLRLSRQHAEEQLRSRLAQLPVQDIPQTKGSSWRVKRNEIQVIEEKPFGVGGWGEVRVAMFRGVKVAAKFIHEAIISPHNIDLFIREMNMAACVHHPNLLLFIGASLDDNKPVIITELMAANLRSIIHALSQDHVISIGTDVACALNYLHLMKPDPIIHRDVSSANVLLEPIGFGIWRAKVSDYGSANFISKVTTTGPGNPSYAAPESSNPKLQSTKMDVYSYGILLLEMATGQFPDLDLQTVQLETLLWQEMTGLVRRCICKDPDGRPGMKDILLLLPQLKK